jgi:hypothetical protein
MKAPQAPQSGPAMRSPHEHQSQSKMAKERRRCSPTPPPLFKSVGSEEQSE